MLSYAEKEAYINFIADIYADMENELIENLASRLKDTDKVSNMAKWQMQKLVELGAYNKENAKIIAKYSGKSEKAIEKIFKDAGYSALQGDMTIYQMAFGKGLIPAIPQNPFASAAIQQILSASIGNAQSYLNLVNTTAYSGMNQTYNKIVSTAYLQTATGLTDLNSAVRKSVRALADKGITAVTYSRKDGRVVNYPIDAAVRMNIRTSITQTAGKLQMQMARDLECNYVEVTSHLGARPEHAVWQGQVYQIDGSSREYPNLVEATGYGSVTGLHGINCRHDFYPFFPGIDTRAAYTYDLEANEKEYRLTQEQRRLENEVRKARRRCVASNALDDKAQFTVDSVKLKRKEAELRDFITKTDRTQAARVQTHGFDRSVSGKAVNVKKAIAKNAQEVYNNGIKTSDKQFGKKIGKHAKDYGFNPGNSADRAKMTEIIQDITRNCDSVRVTTWKGQGKLLPSGERADGEVLVFQKDNDVVITKPTGEFISIMKDAMVQNKRIMRSEVLFYGGNRG